MIFDRAVCEKYDVFSDAAGRTDGKFTFSASDDISAVGFQATAGSGMLHGYYPVFDASAVSRMKAAGGSLIGKTNMDEFGFGMFSVTGTGIPKNPFDPERSCGGSCGGAACAASLIDGHIALGTSAGGSITSPAAFCGVFGLTPTYGRVSRYGHIESVSSMGPIGMLAAKSEILRKYLPVISGKDGNDPVTAAQPELKLGKKKLGSAAIPKGITDGADDRVRKAFEDAVTTLKGMSVDVEYVDMPELRDTASANYVLTAVEAATKLAGYCGMRFGRRDGDLSMPFNDYFVSFRSKYFGTETKLRVIMGTYMTMGENRRTMYLRSLGIRRLAIDRYRSVLKDHDIVLTPSMPFTAPKFDDIPYNSAASYMAGRFAAPPVFCGLPCISVPCGYSDGLPIGMQFVSDHWNEDVLLNAAEKWEKNFDIRTPEVLP
jgi:aspartyl-tRNA(Asn)/glutamyl-tRNA(Gln) amidotransferase subunit A